jgi:Fe-S-cluster-containing hydrogenase component 2
MRIEVDWLTCEACDPCLARKVCRTRALVSIEPGEPVFVEQSRCNACGKCIPACPYHSIANQDLATGRGDAR